MLPATGWATTGAQPTSLTPNTWLGAHDPAEPHSMCGSRKKVLAVEIEVMLACSGHICHSIHRV